MPQSLHQAYAHIVFSTKDRAPLIDATIEPRLHSYLTGIVRELGGSPVIINGIEDHLHLLIQTSKSIADQDFMRQLKGSSSKWMSEQGRPDFKWQRGYGWFSISSKDLPAARTYIENQKSHHQKTNFQDEFRKFLDQYGVDYDERYVWD